MTMLFNDFDVPAGLDDDLTGLPLTKRIDLACPEPGCPNGSPNPGKNRIQPDERSRTDEPVAARPLWQRPVEIYQTQPKDRCVM